MKEIELYTDGSCRPNPGPGGWAYILRYKEVEKEDYGGEQESTNNRMELTAVIQGLSTIKQPCVVRLYSDSEYVVEGIKRWMHNWALNGWKKNGDLWKEIYKLCKIHDVRPVWVQSHNGHIYNERCDRLAKAATWT